MTSRLVFAASLLVRRVLILPMAPRGPLGRSELLPVGVVVVLLGHALLAAGVAAGSRPILALALITALAAVPLAMVGLVVGLTMPWPIVLAGYNVLVAAIGLRAWHEPAAGP